MMESTHGGNGVRNLGLKYFIIFKEHYQCTIKVLFIEETNIFLIIGYTGSVYFYQVISCVFEMLRDRAGYFLAVSNYVETFYVETYQVKELMAKYSISLHIIVSRQENNQLHFSTV